MDRQINIITVQLKTEVNTGSKKVKAYWVAWWRHTGKPLIATGRGGGEKSHGGTVWKHTSSILTLDFLLLWRVSYVCANKSCALMWVMHLRTMCVMMYRCPNVTAAMLRFQLTWHSPLPGEEAVHASFAPEVKPSERLSWKVNTQRFLTRSQRSECHWCCTVQTAAANDVRSTVSSWGAAFSTFTFPWW